MQENTETNMDTNQSSTQEETTQQDAETTATASQNTSTNDNTNTGTDTQGNRLTESDWAKLITKAREYVKRGHHSDAVCLLLNLGTVNCERLKRMCARQAEPIVFPLMKYEIFKAKPVIVKELNITLKEGEKHLLTYKKGKKSITLPFNEENADEAIREILE